MRASPTVLPNWRAGLQPAASFIHGGRRILVMAQTVAAITQICGYKGIPKLLQGPVPTTRPSYSFIQLPGFFGFLTRHSRTGCTTTWCSPRSHAGDFLGNLSCTFPEGRK